MRRTEKLNVMFHGRTVGLLSFTPDNRLNVFEYDKSWLTDGFSISPLELPLKSGCSLPNLTRFTVTLASLRTVFLMDTGVIFFTRRYSAMESTIRICHLLDRLALVGENGMGALTYSPSIDFEQEETVTDFDRLQEMALQVLKEQQDKDAGLLLYNSGNSGGARPKAIFSDAEGHWIVKFRHTYDPKDIGIMEARYNEIARKSGIIVPDFRLVNGRYFASRRFDIDNNGNRIHTSTAGGLMCISLREPFMDYSNLLALTGFITQSREDVEQMYRRMLFNYLTDNKDDHCKNFSFYVVRDADMDTWRWRLAPAYDLTLCAEGYNGEHATSVNGTGNPRLSDFIAVGTKIKLQEDRCREIIEEVRSGSSELTRYQLLE